MQEFRCGEFPHFAHVWSCPPFPIAGFPPLLTGGGEGGGGGGSVKLAKPERNWVSAERRWPVLARDWAAALARLARVRDLCALCLWPSWLCCGSDGFQLEAAAGSSWLQPPSPTYWSGSVRPGQLPRSEGLGLARRWGRGGGGDPGALWGACPRSCGCRYNQPNKPQSRPLLKLGGQMIHNSTGFFVLSLVTTVMTEKQIGVSHQWWESPEGSRKKVID